MSEPGQPTEFSWTWNEVNVRMNLLNLLQRYGESGESCVQIHVNGRYGSGTINLPVWAWERVREASFSRVTPDGRGEQVVRIVLEQSSPMPVVATEAALAKPEVPSEVQRALDQLDRPVGRR